MKILISKRVFGKLLYSVSLERRTTTAGGRMGDGSLVNSQ